MSFHGFRGHTAGKALKTAGYSQASERHTVHSFDQDGRQYYFSAENLSGMPCGLIEPMFEAPYKADPQYFIVNPENTTELYVNYPQLIKDRITAMREYHRRASETAHKSKWETPTMGEYSDDIIAAIGKPPRAYQLAVAAHQGNPWVLGFSDTPDPRLVEYLEHPSREIDEEIDHYDFSASSYAATVNQAPAVKPSAPKPTKITSLAGLAQYRDAVAEASADELPGAEQDAIELDEAFAGMDVSTGDDDIDALPSEDEGAEAQEDPELERLMDLEESLDSAAAPKFVRPENVDRASRQASRRPSQTSVPKKRAARQAQEIPQPRAARPFKREGRKSLADGATPFTGE